VLRLGLVRLRQREREEEEEEEEEWSGVRREEVRRGEAR
jgi:hypothetical protein